MTGNVLIGLFLFVHAFLWGGALRVQPDIWGHAGFSPALYVTETGTKGMIDITLFVPHDERRPGLAHYVEHLTWLAALQGRLASTDADNNAHTMQDTIMYRLSGPREDLDGMLRSLARTLVPLELPLKLADAEREIILREYDFRVAGEPDEAASVALDRYLYQGGPGAISLLGTPEQIRQLSYASAVALHDATHRPGKVMLAASGDITPEDMADALVRTNFPALALRSDLHPNRLALVIGGDMKTVLPVPPQTQPRMLWRKLVALKHPVSYDLLIVQCSLLDDILSSAQWGGLDYHLRYSRQLAARLAVDVVAMDELHVELRVWAEPDRGVSFDDLTSALEAEVRGLRQGVPQETYLRIRKRLIRDLNREKDSAKVRAMVIHGRLAERRLPPSPDKTQSWPSKIDQQGIDDLANALGSLGRVAVAYIGKDR